MPDPEPKPTEPQAGEVTPQAATPAPAPVIETVNGEPFDAARAMKTIEQLRAEIRELKPKAKRADEIAAEEQKRKEAELTELQKLQAQYEKAQAELKALKMSEMRRAVAIKVELPLVFADRLVGETPEALEEDAKKLLAALPKAPKPSAVSPTNPGAGASQGETVAQQRARVYGAAINPLDPEFAKAHGGGVFWPERSLTPKE